MSERSTGGADSGVPRDSEQSSYARACRRWFGESPRQLAARRMAETAAPNMTKTVIEQREHRLQRR